MANRVRALWATPDARAATCICVVLGAIYAGFFNRYAFDDSYVGYTIARSLLQGHGFTFNLVDRTLSTSAPLAPPLYAALAWLFHLDVVAVAQGVSAVAMAVVGFGTYALVRRLSAVPGALCASIIMLCSPFTLLLWSHETLLYIAASILALNAWASNRPYTSALVAGLATLLRGEALLMLPFFWIAQYRRAGFRSAAIAAVISLLPFLVWAAIATHLFGSFASQTIASKRLQLLYPSTLPYLLGAVEYTIYTFSYDHSRVASGIVACCIGLAAYGAAANHLFVRPYRAALLWAAATTALYALLGMEFYFWFLIQFGVALAVCAAALWPKAMPAIRSKPALTGARAAAACVTIATVLFLVLEMRRGIVRGQYWSAAVMPEIKANAYKSLGLWFARHAAPGDRIAYPEFGQIRYYSNRDLVDYLGLVSTGATAQLAQNNAIWSFKRYRPQWVVEDATWHIFVDPLEYDWFEAAYVKTAQLVYPADPTRSSFTIYRLRDSSRIPPAALRSRDVRVSALRAGADGLRIVFTTHSARFDEAEVRARVPASCGLVDVTLARGSTPIAHRSERPHGRIERFSVDVGPQPPGSFALTVSGCALRPAPRLPLRRNIPRLLIPPIETAPAQAALDLYSPDG
ncbi:MAG TPA: hypothetical protein VFA29_07260 [Candidatus Baltobacteraceae bacterium]|nr:hypothetical protein [Candidatus Baltobacteraceae bacterium]